MSYYDNPIQCSNCGVTFPFSIQEQKLIRAKGFTHVPVLCPKCYQSMKLQKAWNTGGYGNNSYVTRQMSPDLFTNYLKSTEIPFEPRTNKQKYCNDRFRKIRN